MATDKIPVPKPGEGEPIVFFDIQLGGKSLSYLTKSLSNDVADSPTFKNEQVGNELRRRSRLLGMSKNLECGRFFTSTFSSADPLEIHALVALNPGSKQD